MPPGVAGARRGWVVGGGITDWQVFTFRLGLLSPPPLPPGLMPEPGGGGGVVMGYFLARRSFAGERQRLAGILPAMETVESTVCVDGIDWTACLLSCLVLYQHVGWFLLNFDQQMRR
ncbi:unnamed protein product [Cuscuta europaea]|uniref:Uncharacterized protein n=1 Tax=Cuscuta europaea TaxID=41803 RepID=A0A9P1E0B0_CUSEU|nr:unnamed protein product [Cuscuta europaea]